MKLWSLPPKIDIKNNFVQLMIAWLKDFFMGLYQHVQRIVKRSEKTRNLVIKLLTSINNIANIKLNSKTFFYMYKKFK